MYALFFIPAVIVGSHYAGIKGVAIAVDCMLLIGIWRIYHPLVETIDFSVRRLLGWPIMAFIAGIGTWIAIESIIHVTLWQSVLVKTGIFVIVFGGILISIEWKDYLRDSRKLWKILRQEMIK